MTNEIAIWHLEYSSKRLIEQMPLFPGPLSLDDATQRLARGGYTTFRTFERFRVLRLQDHFARLEETARLAGKVIRLDRERIKFSLHRVLSCFPVEQIRVRMILDFEKNLGDIYLIIETLHMPGQKEYDSGVKAVTRWLQRENPKAKLTGFIETAAAVRQNIPEGINEVLMVGEDSRILEGLSSNFFGVKEGIIWTAGKGVLAGITRSLVLDVIRVQNIPLRMEGVLLNELADLDEAFITSASRAVLPVTEIDGRKIGSGVPGQVTQLLMKEYQERLAQELEYV